MRKALCFVFLLIITAGLNAQQIDKDIEVTGLKEVYTKGEPLAFNVLTSYQNDVFISVGLQSYIEEDGEWFDQVQNLKKYYCNPLEKYGNEYSLIKPQELFVLKWEPKKANRKRCFNWKVFDGKFRVVVRIKRDMTSETEEFFTSAFIIQ